MRSVVLCMSLCSLVAVSQAATRPVGFYPIGNVAPSHTYSYGTAVSSDGNVIAGESGLSPFGPADTAAGLWFGPVWSLTSSVPATNTIEPYALLWDLNADGTVGVGLTAIATSDPLDPTVSVPGRWTSASGFVPLSTLSGQAHALNATGDVVVGHLTGSTTILAAFRWTAATGVIELPTAGGSASNTLHIAYGVSADGDVVVGRSRNASGQNVAFAWTAALGTVELLQLPSATGASRGQARGINAAGNIIVGWARDSGGAPNAARWTFDRATGASSVESLGDIPGGTGAALPDGTAFGVSDDGNVIVGQSDGPNGDEAFVWIKGRGMFALRQLLIDEYGAFELVDWSLDSAEDVSADGSVITGYGTLDGETQAFVAVIRVPCKGDLNADTFVDDTDFVLFANAYNILDCADPAMPAGCPSDLNNDGFVDDADFVLFADAYNNLICP
jgi:probable HAF family extracellular repeat protein